MENTETKQKNSKLILTNQKFLNLYGITKVVSALPNAVCLEIEKEPLTIEGSDLNITKLDVENKLVDIEGKIASIKYAKGREKQKGFFKRIFG